MSLATAPEFMHDFTDKDAGALGFVHVFEGRYVASDGKIIIWCDGAFGLPDTLPLNMRDGVQKIIGLQNQVEIADNSAALAKSSEGLFAKQETCFACKGAKRVTTQECNVCEGGSCPHCGKECDDCSGSGFVIYPGNEELCPRCKGVGRKLITVMFNNLGLRGDYLALLMSFSGSIGKPFVCGQGSAKIAHPFRFSCAGVDARGMIMPVAISDEYRSTVPDLNLEVVL